MSGIRYTLDTNTVIAMIDGNEIILDLTGKATFIALFVISVIEFLSFAGINEKDKQLLFELVGETTLVSLAMDNSNLLSTIARIRSTYKLKLPDAIIAATTLFTNSILITNDGNFKKVAELQIINY